ncbi:basic proline-rich protein-like [Peromyscus californicus insignis]|uniref:basic proline-rich protein-like n=1 Tax=Peromyscus californicus insignis TaxID=564181 RepID=UPI0022A78994|nr:basic proline-rich protein-like [Peromyscus californicus insignis]
MKPVLDGSPPTEGCGRGRDPRSRWPSLPSLAEVTEFRALGHAPAPRSPAASPVPAAPRGGPAARRGPGPGAAARRRRRCEPGTPERHPRPPPPQRRPQRRTMRGRPATHLSRGRAGCPPGPRLPGALWDRDSGMPATGRRTGRVGSREHGERPDSSGCGERLGHVAVQPLIAARRFPPLRGPSPAPAPPGRRADAPAAELPRAAPAPARPPARPPASPLPRPPARSLARPGPRRLPPLQLRGLRAQPGRPTRLDGRLESAAGPAGAEAPHCLEPGGRRAGKKPQGCWRVSSSSSQHSTVSEFCGKTDRHPSTNPGHLPV